MVSGQLFTDTTAQNPAACCFLDIALEEKIGMTGFQFCNSSIQQMFVDLSLLVKKLVLVPFRFSWCRVCPFNTQTKL